MVIVTSLISAIHLDDIIHSDLSMKVKIVARSTQDLEMILPR